MSPAVSPGTEIPRPVTEPVPLARLADGLPAGEVVGAGDTLLTGMTMASALVRPGDLFAAAPGSTVHGARYARDAVAAGAVAVLTDRAGLAEVPAGVPALLVDDVRARAGEVAAAVYGRPSARMRVLGVTGTSGKTTTTYLIEAGLRAAGRRTGLVGTTGTHIGEDVLAAAFTTPEAPELQALFAVMIERGVTDVAMEVSSHALALGRVEGTRFDVAGFTNLSEDHLDFHGDMRHYYAAKRHLLEIADRRVVVDDDEEAGWAHRLLAELGAMTTVSRSARQAGWHVSGGVRTEPDGSTRFAVRRAQHGAGPERFELGCAIPGGYNVDNVLLALAMLDEAGVEPTPEVVDAISRATVPGRMEPVHAGQDYLAVVDYSHKPAAVDGALRALRPLTRGRLIVVLGCGGDRDRGKRPHMGAIAARGADLLIVTDDNPRSEDPAAIRRAMLDGALAVPAAVRGEVREVGDRGAAIAAAVAAAGSGDTLLVAGKGHETGQEVAGVVHPFDDRVALRAAIGARP